MANNKEVFGDFLPNIYIDRIILDSKGNFFPKRGNPHIQGEDENTREKEDDKLYITVDFSIRYMLGNDSIGAWLKDKNLQEYLKIKIIESREPETSTALATGAYKDDLRKYSKSITSEILTIKECLGSPDSDLNSLIKNYSSLDSDGNTIVKLSFQKKFISNDKDLYHLAFFAFSYIDFDLLAENENVGLEDAELAEVKSLLNGKLTSELIIDKKLVVSQAYIFFTPSGDPWAGLVHQLDDDTWMTGLEGEADPIELERQQVENNKVQDFREFDKVFKSELDLRSVEEGIFKTRLLSLKNDNMIPARKESYFSEIFLSKDRLNRARFAFAVDYLKILKDNSLFGKLYKAKGVTMKTDLSKESTIVSLSIKRRRVKKDGNIFNKDESVVTLVTSSNGNLTNDSGGISEIKLSLEGGDGIKFFNGFDSSVGDLTSGLYQYGIELVVEDRTSDILTRKLKGLTFQRNKLYEYYIEGSKLGLTKYLTEISDPHIDHAWEKQAGVAESSGNYDPVSNSFTQKFIDDFGEEYKEVARSATVDFFKVTELITTPTNLDEQRQPFLNMMSPEYGSPAGIQLAIDLFDDLISKLESILDNKLSKNRNSITEELQIDSGSNHSFIKMEHWFKNNHHDASIAKNFGYDYLSSGDDYRSGAAINKGELLTTGLKHISPRDFKVRAGNETDKYYVENSAHSWSFLSPTYCYFETTGVFNFYEPNKDSYSLQAANILLYNTNSSPLPRKIKDHEESNTLNPFDIDYKKTMKEFYSDLNLSVLPHLEGSPSLEKIISQEPDPELNPNDLFLSLTKTFSKNGLTSHASVKNPLDKNEKIIEIGNRKIDVNKLGLTMLLKHFNDLINHPSHRKTIYRSNGWPSPTARGKRADPMMIIIKTMPLQVLSLLNDDRSIDNFETDPLKDKVASYFQFRYGLINRIEVLTEFKGKDIRVRQPIWRTMTQKDWQKTNLGKSIICRMKPYECPILGINRSKGLELSVYDNYFILGLGKQEDE